MLYSFQAARSHQRRGASLPGRRTTTAQNAIRRTLDSAAPPVDSTWRARWCLPSATLTIKNVSPVPDAGRNEYTTVEGEHSECSFICEFMFKCSHSYVIFVYPVWYPKLWFWNDYVYSLRKVYLYTVSKIISGGLSVTLCFEIRG